LFDHFVVVGTPGHLCNSPKVLFQYPPNTSVEIPGLPDFCFPSGVCSKELPESVCKSEMIALLHNQQYLKQPGNSFVFLFTDQESQVFYGVCVHKEEILEEPPQYMKDIIVPPSIKTTTTRCYCLITKFPFFRLHFDFLFSLFAVEHLSRLESEAPSILEEKAEIEVFLSPSRPKKRPPPRFLARSDSGSFLLDSRSSLQSPRGTLQSPREKAIPKLTVQKPSNPDLSSFQFDTPPREESSQDSDVKSDNENNDNQDPEPEELPIPLLNVLDSMDKGTNEDDTKDKATETGSSSGSQKRNGVRRHCSEGEKTLSSRLDASADAVISGKIDFHPCSNAKVQRFKNPRKGTKPVFCTKSISEYNNISSAIL